MEIRERMFVFGSQSYKEVVQLSLSAEKLNGERMSRDNFQKRKGFGFVFGQLSKRSQSSNSSGNSSSSRSRSVTSSQSI